MTEHEPDPYSRARIVGALALIALVCLLGVFDAVQPDFELQPLQLGLLVGSASLLLGVEAIVRRLP